MVLCSVLCARLVAEDTSERSTCGSAFSSHLFVRPFALEGVTIHRGSRGQRRLALARSVIKLNSVMDVRVMIYQQLLKEPDRYKGFVNGDCGEYLHSTLKHGEWGDDLCLHGSCQQALATSF